MSIYPGGKPSHLRYKFDIAAIDLPIPSDLGRDDAQEWQSYCDCLSPAQRIRKFGQALDEFHTLMDKAGPNPLKIPEDDQAVLYSKWLAATILNVELSKGFNFDTERSYRDPSFIKSDIDKGLFCLTDLLKGVNSSDLTIWEDRRKKHNQITDETILPLLNKFHGYKGKPAKAAQPTP
jgi:hypothetical protein